MGEHLGISSMLSRNGAGFNNYVSWSGALLMASGRIRTTNYCARVSKLSLGYYRVDIISSLLYKN